MNILKKIKIKQKLKEKKIKIKKGKILNVELKETTEILIGRCLKNSKKKIGIKILKKKSQVDFFFPRQGSLIKDILFY